LLAWRAEQSSRAARKGKKSFKTAARRYKAESKKAFVPTREAGRGGWASATQTAGGVRCDSI
jgi:hypothetical protein